MQKQCNFLTYLCQDMVQWIMKVCLYATESELRPVFGHLSFYLIHNELEFFIIWKFTSDFNDSSLCFLTKTANISPVEFFSALHRALEQSILHKYLIILRMYWVVVSKSVSTGINLFDYTVQCYSVARRLLPSFYCVIWKYIWKLWHLEADSVGGSVAGLTRDFDVVTF